jgi:hypothetical protein
LHLVEFRRICEPACRFRFRTKAVFARPNRNFYCHLSAAVSPLDFLYIALIFPTANLVPRAKARRPVDLFPCFPFFHFIPLLAFTDSRSQVSVLGSGLGLRGRFRARPGLRLPHWQVFQLDLSRDCSPAPIPAQARPSALLFSVCA